MSPRDKNLALVSAAGGLTVAVYLIPAAAFLYAATLALALCCTLCLCRRRDPLPARLGLKPRAGLTLTPAALRCLWGRLWGRLWGWLPADGAGGGGPPPPRRRPPPPPAAAAPEQLPESQPRYRQRGAEPRESAAVYRREALSASDSFLFSPRDLLMGSYIGKPDSPPADFRRPRGARNPREQLRDALARPNHAVCTPNRRLSFAGETPGAAAARFTITPQRHYPLQQAGASSLGVLPPVSWDAFRKKSILSPRNSPAHSPVTVKIARPQHAAHSLEHLSGAALPRTPADPRAPADPCSRESVLKVLKESRKREAAAEEEEEHERSFAADPRSKRRRNDSGGSTYSAFEPLLPNGTPSQLVPKPGSLKRGMTSVSEEGIIKRSRTSSISSGSGGHAPRGTPGSKRNPIHSSYSSTLGISQWKRPSAPSSPLSSPGSSRSQTPDTAAKRPREDDGASPSSASSVRSDKMAAEKAPVSAKQSHAPEASVSASSQWSGSGGNRKRRIQLVSRDADDRISLPPPPELGYTVTAKDLDEEKKEAMGKIQKVLETPAPQPEKSVAAPAAAALALPSAVSSAPSPGALSSLLAAPSLPAAGALSSLLAAPLPAASAAAAVPVINLDPTPSTATVATTTASAVAATTAVANPLLEALKMKGPTPGGGGVSAPSASASALASAAPPLPLLFSAKTSTAAESAKPVAAAGAAPAPAPPSQPQPPPAAAEQPSAFTQVGAQLSKATGSAASVASLFGLSAQTAAPQHPASSAPGPAPQPAPAAASSSASLGSANPLLPSGFKPIFSISTGGSSAPESKPAVQNFKPVFGSDAAGAGFATPSSLGATVAAPAGSAPSMFGASAPSSAASASAQQPVKSFFGNWSATTTASSAPAPAPTPAPAPAIATPTGGAFQFGATSAAAATSTFTFGAQTDAASAAQKVFAFGNTAPAQNTTAASFGGFGGAAAGTATAAPTPAAAAAATSASTQPTFTFGKPAAQSTFGASAPAPAPFSFGGGAAASQPASNPASGPSPFTFGSTPATAPPAFSTPAKPAFGNSGFAFGATAAPSAPPTFGATTQTQSSSSNSFAFGGAAPQPAPPAAAAQPPAPAFNFGGGMAAGQFGSPAPANPTPQMAGFNFGAAAAADKTPFGTSTPSFGQNPGGVGGGGPNPFGSPPLQGFGGSPFGATGTPSFSIGAGSKPSGARQRLQARRQHNRKK